MSPVLVFLPLTYIFLWPIVSYILRRDGQHQSALLIGLTAVSLSTGTLGVLLFWAGLLPGRLITAWLAPGIIVIGLGTGLVVNPGWLSPARWLAYWKRGVASVLRSPVEMLLIAATLCAGVIILAYDLYYPFLGDDTLVRYGWQAQEIYASGRLPESVWGYPPLAQMNMATAWLLAGRPVEQMARLFPAVMALGTLGATFLLGRQVHSRQAGLMGAVVLALTPMFINNATLAYTDIPTAFPLTLAAVFMLRWWESDTLTDALFAGLLLAAALFTKQSALTWAVSMAAIALLKGMVKGHGLLEIAASLLALFLPSLVIAVPWYVRNGLLAGPGNILPVAGLYHVLGPDSSWLGLIPSLAWPGEFGFVLTAFYTVGWVAGFYRAIQQGWRLLT
nr:glycosyltransferase family 39 protein [Anaerolineae bacterium]